MASGVDLTLLDLIRVAKRTDSIDFNVQWDYSQKGRKGRNGGASSMELGALSFDNNNYDSCDKDNVEDDIKNQVRLAAAPLQKNKKKERKQQVPSSAEEFEKRRQQGQSYKCGKEGHVARKCSFGRQGNGQGR